MKSILYILFFAAFSFNSVRGEDSSIDSANACDVGFFSAKSKPLWNIDYYAGLNLCHLPLVIVEEEISQSPMLCLGARIGLPYRFNFSLGFQSNYIANYGLTELYWSALDSRLNLEIGGKFAIWFGHLEMESIHLKTMGWALYPTIKLGYSFDKATLTADFETQFNRMFTYSEEQYLGRIKNLYSGIGARLTLESPLWNDNVVALSFKMNYTKFFYQAWLSYNTIDEYLLYPEIMFAFEF
jgi:hypothetical protein